jgi:multiple sugar transport system permease protein
MVLPQIVLVIPFLQLLKSIKLTDTLIGLILVYLVVTTPASIWFLISFFDKIPKSLEEAAMIDGCNSVQTLFRVIVPIMKPGIAAVCIYSFFLAWNEFIFALSYLNSSNRLTLPIFLARFVGQYQTRWGDLFAGSVVAYVIPLIAFAVLQQQFISALVKGAVKE